MGQQFIVRSQGLKHHIKELKTVAYDGVKITRCWENNIAVFELSDPDAIIELVVRKPSLVGNSEGVDVQNTGGDVNKVLGNRSAPAHKIIPRPVLEHAKTGTKLSENCPSITQNSICIIGPSDGNFDGNMEIETAAPESGSIVQNSTSKFGSSDGNSNDNDTEIETAPDTGSKVGVTEKTSPTDSSDDRPMSVDAALNLIDQMEDDSAQVKSDAVYDMNWDTQYEELVAYKLEHSTVVVPYKKNQKLHNFVKRQRDKFKRGKMLKRKLKLLLEIGLVKPHEVRDYKKTTTDNTEPITDTNFRTAEAASALTSLADKAARVKKASVHEKKWMAQYNKLVAYKLEHGTVTVSQNGKKSYKNLQIWKRIQRNRYTDGTLTMAMVEKLRDIGVFSEEEADNYETKPNTEYETRMINNWNSRYNDLCAYVQQYGKLDLAGRDKPLSRWICFQRSQYKAGNMSAERIARLNDIGMLTTAKREVKEKEPKESRRESRRQSAWNLRYSELEAYKHKHGNLYCKKTNPTLKRWATEQAAEFRKGNLSNEQVVKLIKIGCLTEKNSKSKDEIENERYSQLLEFKENHGHCNVPHQWKENRKLAQYVQYSRRAHKEGIISDEKYAKLSEIGFIWNLFEDKWNRGYTQLMEFQRKHGHCAVPKDYETHPKLHQWISSQRQSYRDGKLNEVQKTQLDDLGFVWEADTSQEKWNTSYAYLVEFQREHGHCRVPDQYEPYPTLSKWIRYQRKRLRDGKLKEVQKAQLDDLGFVWNVVKTTENGTPLK